MIHIVLTTPQEVFANVISTAKGLSERIMKLSDLTTSPLMPGETPDNRRHQIAKFGKALAEAFIMIDKLMAQAADDIIAHNRDVTSDAPGASGDKPDNPDAN